MVRPPLGVRQPEPPTGPDAQPAPDADAASATPDYQPCRFAAPTVDPLVNPYQPDPYAGPASDSDRFAPPGQRSPQPPLDATAGHDQFAQPAAPGQLGPAASPPPTPDRFAAPAQAPAQPSAAAVPPPTQPTADRFAPPAPGPVPPPVTPAPQPLAEPQPASPFAREAQGVAQQPYADQEIFAAAAQASPEPGEPGPGFAPPGRPAAPPPGPDFQASRPTPPPSSGYDPFARPSQPPPNPPAPPPATESGEGGGRRPLLIAGIIALVMALATVGWLVFGNRDEPTPPPETPDATQTSDPSPTDDATNDPTDDPSQPSADPSDAATGDKSGIDYEDSTRNPPWTPTRDEPREGMAPVTQIGETAEVIETDDTHGLVTVTDHVWSAGEGNRVPREGHMYLLVEVEIEAFDNPFPYAPGRFEVIDQNNARYDFFFASPFEEQYPQFQNGDLPPGKVMRGWVLFELPQQDVVVTYQALDEEGMRVAIPGGPVVPLAEPEIPLDETFEDTQLSRLAEVHIEGATWFTEARTPPAPGKEFLGVKITFVAVDGRYYSGGSRFDVIDVNGDVAETYWMSDAQVGPGVTGFDVAEGDQITGWLYFEVPRGETTLTIEGMIPEARITIPG